MSFPVPPSQGHRPRPPTITARQPGIQLAEQVLAPGQQRRRLGQPNWLACDPPALLHQLADRDPTTVRDDGARPPIRSEPGPGQLVAGYGPGGFGGATLPWMTPAATPPRSALIFTSRPAATA